MTATEADSLFGKPTHLVTKTTTEGNFQIYKYDFAQANLAAVNTRVLLLEFKEGKLNGYFSWSSFSKDKSHFDSSAEAKLKTGVGKFTKDDVLALLGQPEGKALCPSIINDFKDKCEKNTEVWGWYMSDNISLWVRRDVKSAQLVVSFDSSGKVSGVELEENSNPP